MPVKDTDKGYRKRLAGIFGTKPTTITVGIHSEQGNVTHEKSALTVLDIGTIHEFGLGNNPERSFIRAWVDENKTKHAAGIRNLMASVAQGKRTADQVAELLGLRFVGEIQRRMAQGIPPPLTAATIARKGSSVPLIDTGQLRSSIQFQVHFGKK